MILRVNFFGKFEMIYDGSPITGIRSQKSLEVVAFLLLKRTGQSRDSLANVVWGDQASTHQSRKYLRNTLWQVQKKLSSRLTHNGQLFKVDARSISVDPTFPIWTDVEEFELRYDEVRDLGGAEMSSDQASRLKEAVDLYKGAFLEGWYSDWCLVHRERTEHLVLLMLDKLMESAADRGEYESGILYGERILSFDRAREVTHRNLMKLFYYSGDRTSALRQFQLCESILREELEIGPSERTRAVLDAIRNDALEHDRSKKYEQN